MTGLTIDDGSVLQPVRTRDPHWQALLDSAGEGIWGVDLNGDCTFVNRMATQIFGFSSLEMIGNNMHALVHHHHADGTPYLDADCPVYGVFRNSKPLRQQTDTMFRKDGSRFLAEMSAQPVLIHDAVAGVVITFRDITERHRQQQELKDAYELTERRTAELDAVIESMPHGVFIATSDGNIRSNRLARHMTGETFPAQLHTLERALAGEESTQTIHADESWIRSVAAPILLNGQILGGVAVNTDITQSRMQEHLLIKSEKLAALGQLATSIAHEINNPLESITNLLYLVRNSSNMDEIQQYTKIAEQELARVSEITLQTLRFHRQLNRPAKVSLADLIEAVLSLYTGRLMVRGISTDVKSSNASPVMCLEGEVRQVLNNLIRNAVDAMADGGRLSIRVRPGCGVHRREGVYMTIADTGEGISPQILEHLFEPFHTTKQLTGTGLGLWVSKGIIDKHGGSIQVRTRRTVPRGTVFSLWLPADGAEILAAAREQETGASGSTAYS